jgi:hypothetical protein
MSDEDEEKVRRLGVRFKAPPDQDGPNLLVVQNWGVGECNHKYYFASSGAGLSGRMVHVQYLIREGETEIECSRCNIKLDPMWVLRQVASEESQWMRTRAAYQEEMKRLSERKRTQCQHCGKMTGISHR